MNIKSIIYTVFLSILALNIASCSKDDDYTDPAGTTAINLLNEDNGKTLLGNSDVYIDKANNFYGRSCVIASLGKKNGLENLPAHTLNGLSNKAAVESGNAYQIFRDIAIRRFPSGKLALNIAADYYNVYVVSQIKQGDTAVTGATVKYVNIDVPDNGLPKYDSNIGTFHSYQEEITIQLPSSDFEYEHEDGSIPIYYQQKDNKLILRLEVGTRGKFGVFIRVGNSYTYVYGRSDYTS